ncbi:hypothetical protein ACFPRL_29215 [Pseudoclavibacter helvolus]
MACRSAKGLREVNRRRVDEMVPRRLRHELSPQLERGLRVVWVAILEGWSGDPPLRLVLGHEAHHSLFGKILRCTRIRHVTQTSGDANCVSQSPPGHVTTR